VIVMIDYDSLEEFRDPETYDLACDSFDEDWPFMEQWAQSLGGPLLDLACGTGRMALRLAAQGYSITGVDIVPEMIGRARQKAAAQSASIEWGVADARDFHLQKQFRGIYMLMNAFQFLHTRADHEAMLTCVAEHLQPEGYFLFETRNPSLRNLYEVRHDGEERFTAPDGRQLVIMSEQRYDPITQIQHYTSQYYWLHDGEQKLEKTLRVGLRYVFPQEMEALLHYNGFSIVSCYGNWQQESLTATSPAMICICKRRL
jgi:2-polyprenyl-3-methyl-5-hydroxy-6-metoxy-1,4-benzoquinol methylase